MNAKLLNVEMILHNDTQKTLAHALGISRQSLNAKIHGRRDFSQSEIIFIKNRYNLKAKAVDDIFFSKIVS